MTNDAPAVLVHVSPEGNDAWSGRIARPNPGRSDGPLATVHAARDAARAAGFGKAKRIVLQPGYYFLASPLVLQPGDQGLSIEAANGGPAALYGGRRITGWVPDGARLWSAPVPEAVGRKWDFRMLVVNGRYAERARLPAEGTFTHETPFDVPWMSTTGGGWKRKPTEAELTTMQYKGTALDARLDIHSAEITVYHMWDESLVGIASLDPVTRRVRFANPSGHPPGAFGVQKYVVWNTREGMTTPGQWHLDRTAGKLVYWPLSGEDMRKAVVLAPTMESILQIRGTPDAPARDIAVRGLTLSVANTPLKAGGFGAGAFDGAVSIQNAEGCTLSGLTIVNVAGQGIRAIDVRDCTVQACHVHHTGACGMIVRGNASRIVGNHIHDIGVTYPSAIAMTASGSKGPGLEISRNTIHDTPYSAITCSGEDHRIESNRISRAMQVLHDGAGIYITFCKRVVLRGNFIHDIVDTGGYGASAYYLDEQAEDCLVEGNLALRVATPSHNHMARRNTIRLNVFIADGDARLTFPRSSDYTFEQNVLCVKGRITFTKPDALTSFRSNVLFSAAGVIEGIPLNDYTPAGSTAIGVDSGNALEDPVIVSFEDGNVRFGSGSPAAKLGIAAIDVSGAGKQ